MTPFPLPGSKWLGWMRDSTLRFGTLVGVYLTLVMCAALLLANRVPFLETFADVRNAICYGAFGVAALLPLWRYRHSATRLFTAATLGWLIFSLSYWLAGALFVRLHTSFRRPFHIFMIGATLYGLAAVAIWVAEMVLHARTQPITASRRRPY
jgi:hypothetical protein